MPQLKHTFTSGRMNKDLDERLVPNGEYIDALNIQVGHSTGSDLGAIENILGNTAQSALGLTNATVIGSIRHDSTNCIYWFITADGVDCIAEYNQTTDTVSPVIVDKNSVLNFSTSYLITGVNIIDRLLFWTDNNTEPKKINIDTFKTGSTNFSTHTPVYGAAFAIEDVKVIKRGPKTAPVITTNSTRRIYAFSGATANIGCGINFVTFQKNFTTTSGASFFSVKEIGESITLATTAGAGIYPNWTTGDVISLSASKVGDNNFTDEYRVRLTITSITYNTSSQITTVVGDILTISPNITNNTFDWETVLEEGDAMFPLSFPRFAYRWKYKDGEYSVFSPFSEVAFVPGKFEYSSADAYNDGMVNNMRYLMLNGFETSPKEVDSLDILYKDSNSNVIYKVENITTTSYVIESELIGHVIEPNQLLRPWDNVPRKALAQEVTSNRVLYGNYLHGYDMVAGGSDIRPAITAGTAATTHSTVGSPLPSVKALRSYQVGIVYADDAGRESPVFTSKDATTVLEKKVSKSTNKITAQATSTAPSWATYFKYFIKDTSNEYYNLALDRFYEADDGNLWLSFPSAERNKIKEESYLLIKKAHDSNTSVDDNTRYRVLDISHEAPKDVVYTREHYTNTKATLNSTPYPKLGIQEFLFDGPTDIQDPKFFSAIESNTIVRFFNGSDVSDFYEVLEGGFTGESTVQYRVKLDREIDQADSWLGDLAANATFNVSVYKSEARYKKEYGGKFFVKIHRDPAFDEAIVDPLSALDPNYVSAFTGDVEPTILDDPDDGFAEPGGFAFGKHADSDANAAFGAPTNGSATFGIGYAPHPAGVVAGVVTNNKNTSKPWFDTGLVAGKFIRFDGDTTNTYYEIQNVATTTVKRIAADAISAENTVINKVVTLTGNVSGTFTTSQITLYDSAPTWSSIFTENSTILSSSLPAIFETEPREAVDLDFYYEATNAFPISEHSNVKTLDWFNCYSFGNGVESDRVRDDYNAPRIGKGVKVSAPLDEPYSQERKSTGLIFSGIYNSTSGVNKLNQFAMAEAITKDLNPSYGSIQKLHTRDSDTIVMCEDKILRVMTNKDALYNADGNANITSNQAVLGQSVPFAGEFGISKNPESFASYGFRTYFSDKARGVVLRLSRDGLTEISSHGMSDFFVDNLKVATTVFGSFDDQTNCYNITLNSKTASFKENVRGWPTLKSFIPESGLSLNNTYYTFKNGELYSHDNASRGVFYGGAVAATSMTFMINDAPSNIKNYQTLSYEGSAGWTAPSIETDQQSGRVQSFLEKEGIWYNYIKGLDTTWDNSSFTGSLDTKEFSVQGIGAANQVVDNTGSLTLTIGLALNVSLQAGAGDIMYFKDISADRVVKIGACTAISGDVITCTHTAGQPIPEAETDFIFFAKNSEVNTSGIVGYYAQTKMEVTSSSMKELYAVNSEAFISS